MRSVSEETRITMNTRRNFVNYAHVTLHDGTELNLTPSDFRISGNNFTDDWNEGESFQLGSAIGKTATLLLDNTDGRTEEIEGEIVVYPHGKFSEYDFYMAYFELYIHLPDATHYEGELIDEVISIGTFTVTTPASHGATIEITGVDNMHMFDRPFDDCTLDFAGGQTLESILQRCCDDCGVVRGWGTSFLNDDIVVYNKPQNITYREVVSFIAQIAGCNAVISVTGALKLKYYNMSPINEILDGGRFLPWDGVDNVRDTLDGGSFEPWTGSPEDAISGGNFTDPLEYHNLTATNGTSVSTDDIHFTGIMVSYVVNSDGTSETKSLHYPDVSNWDDYAMQIVDNPFVETQAIANTVATSVWNIIAPLNFRVFSCQSIQDPTIEAGDCALVYDVKGNIYPTIITNVRFVTGGMTEVSCTAESPVKQNSRYVNPAAKAVAKAKENMDAYNTMVAHFNEIANAALGYRKTEVVDPDYGTITYLHDQPRLEDSTYIVKIIGTGIFISDDGGASYNNGVDITTATMLMNLIYVHGLTADWIVAGTIDTNRLNVSGIITAINNNGTTYINGGKIATGTMNANRIGAGTIDASVISVTNLNASNITTGTMSASRITSGTMSAARISGGTLTLGGNNNGNGVCVVQNASGTTKVKLDNAGITATAGTIGGITINSSGIGTGGSGTNNNAIHLNEGDFGVATERGSSWSALCYGKEANTRTGWSKACCVLWNGGDSGAGFHVCNGAPNSHSSFTAMKDNVFQVYVSNDLKAYFNESGAHTTSDIRRKKSIQTLSEEKIRKFFEQVNPVSFEFKDDASNITHFGIIAQEIQQALSLSDLPSDSMVKICDNNSEGNDDMLYVNYQELHGIELAAIKDLYKVIQNQQAEIDDLKARLERLESIVNNHE